MRIMLGLALLFAMPPVAEAESTAQSMPPRFVISHGAIEPVADELQNSRFDLQSSLVSRSGRTELDGALFSLKAQLGIEGASCVPDSIFEDGFEAPP